MGYLKIYECCGTLIVKCFLKLDFKLKHINQIIDCGLFNLSENWQIMLRGIFCLLTIQLFVIFLNTDKVQAGIANETSDPIVLRSGVNLKEFNNVLSCVLLLKQA